MRVVAERIFERLEEAHAVLSDATARRRYIAQLDRAKTQEAAGGAEPAPRGESPQVVAERIYFQGVAHLRARRYRDGAEAFRQATALAPAQASYRSALGWALYRQAPADARAVAAGLADRVGLSFRSAWNRLSACWACSRRAGSMFRSIPKPQRTESATSSATAAFEF